MAEGAPPHRIRSIEPARFREVLGRYATGVTVITVLDEEGPAGLAVNSFASVSLEPPLVLFCASRTSRSWPRIRRAGRFAVNILSEAAEPTCEVFSSKEDDKFAFIDWVRSQSDLPRLTESLAYLECAIEAIHEGGDHEIVIGRVLTLQEGQSADPPLIFFGGCYRRLLPA